MIKLIAHRGNTEGPMPLLENSPWYLRQAVEEGFDVEIDVWAEGESIYFGHDGPQYFIGNSLHSTGLPLSKCWFHAKNCRAIDILNKLKTRWFWHENDAYTLTSDGQIWTYPTAPVINNCVWNQPERQIAIEQFPLHMADSLRGICSDYVLKLKQQGVS